MKYPAMWEFLRDAQPEAARRKRAKTTPDVPSVHADALHALPGEDVVAALLLRRAELGDDADDEWRLQFSWKLRGGKWTGDHKGVAFDCYAAYVTKGGLAEDFVACFPLLSMSASWSIALYGDDACLVLARAWIHRMYYFFRIWVDAGSSLAHIYTAGDLLAYVEPLSFVQLAVGANSSLAARILQIRSLCSR